MFDSFSIKFPNRKLVTLNLAPEFVCTILCQLPAGSHKETIQSCPATECNPKGLPIYLTSIRANNGEN